MFKIEYPNFGFIIKSIVQGLINPYLRSKIGGLWNIINPLIMISIYALILSNVLTSKFDNPSNENVYTIYLISGMIPWVYFNDLVLKCSNVFLKYKDLLTKVRFSRISLVLIELGISTINHFIFTIIMISCLSF